VASGILPPTKPEEVLRGAARSEGPRDDRRIAMGRREYESINRAFDAPRDEVFDAVLSLVRSRAVKARLIASNRSLGLITLRLGRAPVPPAARLVVMVGSITRERTEVTIEDPTGPRSLGRRSRTSAGELLDAIGHAVRTGGGGFTPGLDARDAA